MQKKTQILTVYFFSGLCGLVYELLWLRMLSLIFGNTTQALSAVLVSYMAGLSIGSWFFGKKTGLMGDFNLLRVFGYLMFGIGAYSALTPYLFKGVETVFIIAPFFHSSEGLLTATRFLFAFAVILFPTVLMGGTFPVLSKWVVSQDFPEEKKTRPGASIAALYSINTLGAALGAFLTAYVLIRFLGVKGTLYSAAVLNVLLGFYVFGIREAKTAEVPEKEQVLPAPAGSVDYLLLGGILLSGFTALSLEVVWTRILSMVLGSYVYAVGVILSAFLAGIGLGSWLYKKYAGKIKTGEFLLKSYSFGFVQAGIGITVLALLPVFGLLPFVFLPVLQAFGSNMTVIYLFQFLFVFVLLLVPAVLFGVTIPLACSLYILPRISGILHKLPVRAGFAAGAVFSANTFGAILGSLSAGFILIPLIGLQKTVISVAWINLIIGIVFIWTGMEKNNPLKKIAVSFIVFFATPYSFLVPQWDRNILTSGVYANAAYYLHSEDGRKTGYDIWKSRIQDKEILYYKEGISSTVEVSRKPGGNISMSIDGKIDASNDLFNDMPTQLLLAYMPSLIHRGTAEKALVIGLGSGVTLGAVQQELSLKEIDCVEIEKAVIEGSAYFSRYNNNCLKDERTRITVTDGRNFLLFKEKYYDIIISEPSNPWIGGVSNLLTKEYFQLVKKRLSPGGVFCQWIPYYRIPIKSYKSVLRTFREVFPYATLWVAGAGDTLLIASDKALEIDLGRISGEIKDNQGMRDNLKQIDRDDVLMLVSNFIMGQNRMSQYSGTAPLNTDERPYVEFTAPQAMYDFRQGAINQSTLLEAMESVSGYIPDFTDNLKLGKVYLNKRLFPAAIGEFAKVLVQRPDNAEACYYSSQAYKMFGRPAQAEEMLKKGYALNPKMDRVIEGAE